MSESLLSVGLDVGTTSTQMILSRLQVENRAGSFAVPDMKITRRQVVYESAVHFTPLLREELVDAQALKCLVEKEYALAGIRREQVNTGAVIITGETSRKENAAAVLQALSDFAGDFVVATAGPELESILAAKGAGAVAYSEETGAPVLHMDIGGGTSNLALIREGKIVATGCLNVGGRLVRVDRSGCICYLSPVLTALCDLRIGEPAREQQLFAVAKMLVQALEMAAGLREPTALLDALWTKEMAAPAGVLTRESNAVISFSGGVADCIETEKDVFTFQDLGVLLGRAIRESRLCQGAYRLGTQTIRATVIGAGCHSAQLSGSTVFYRNVVFPLKNLPVICLSRQEQQMEEAALIRRIREKRAMRDGHSVLALPGFCAPGYAQVRALAQTLAQGLQGQPLFVAVEQDMAKALGQALALAAPCESSCLCIDSVKLSEGSFLDVGAPVGPALPVVVKTLILSHGEGKL